MNKLLLAVLLGILPLAGHAGSAYKWMDEQGNVHYSQQPPPQGAEVKDVFDVPKPEAAPPPPEPTPPPEDKQALEKPEDAAKLTGEELNKINCERAKSYLDTVTSQKTLGTPGEDGKLTPMSEEQRQARIRQAEAAVKQHCTPAAKK